MNYLENFIKKCNYPKESINDILTAGEKLKKQDESFILSKILEYAKDYSAFDFKKANEELAEIAKKINISEKTVWLVFYILLSKELEGIYAKNNIDNEIYVNSMMDLKYKTLECKETDGVWGIVPVFWYESFFNLTLFALGRLQFEVKEFGYEYNKNGLMLSKTDKVINIHIPSSGKLHKEDCIKSFKQAQEFFKDKVPNAVFVCHSWLLFPKNREILNEKSNIVMFMDFFDIHHFEEEVVFGNAWRIFGRAFDKDIVPKTTLQKEFYDYLVKGNKVGWGSGVFALKDSE